MGNPEIIPPDFGKQFKQSLDKVDKQHEGSIPTGAADSYHDKKPHLKVVPDKAHYGTASRGKESGSRGSRTGRDAVEYDSERHGKTEGKPLTEEALARQIQEGRRRQEMYEKAQAEFEENESRIAEGRFKNKKSWQVIAEAVGWEKQMVQDPSVLACLDQRERLRNTLMGAGLRAFEGNDRKMAQFLEHYDQETISNRTRKAEVDMRAESSLTGRTLVGFANMSKNFKTWMGSKYKENGKTTVKSFMKGMATSAGISIAIATALGAALPALGIAAFGLSATGITAIGMRGFGALGAGYIAKKEVESLHMEAMLANVAERVEAKLAIIKQKTDIRWRDVINGLEREEHRKAETMTIEDREAAFAAADKKHKEYALATGFGALTLGTLISHFGGEVRASGAVQSVKQSFGHALDKVASLWGGVNIGRGVAYAADIPGGHGPTGGGPPLMEPVKVRPAGIPAGDQVKTGGANAPGAKGPKIRIMGDPHKDFPEKPDVPAGKPHEYKAMAGSSKSVEVPAGGEKAGQALEKVAEGHYKVKSGDTTYGILKKFFKGHATKCGFDPDKYPGMSRSQALDRWATSKTMGEGIPQLLKKSGYSISPEDMGKLRHIIHPNDQFDFKVGSNGYVDIDIKNSSGMRSKFDLGYSKGGGHEAATVHHGARTASSASEIPGKGKGAYNPEEARARKGITRSPREIAAQKILDDNARIRANVLWPDELDARAHSMAMNDLRTNYEYLQHVMKKSIGNSFRLSEKVEKVAEAVQSFATLPKGSMPENLTFAEGEYNQKSAKFLTELFRKFPYRPGQDMRDYLIKIPHEKIVELRNIYKL